MRDAKAMGFVERLTGLDRDSNVFAHKSVLVEKVGQRVPQINGAMWPVVIRFACVHSLQRKLLLALSLRLLHLSDQIIVDLHAGPGGKTHAVVIGKGPGACRDAAEDHQESNGQKQPQPGPACESVAQTPAETQGQEKEEGKDRPGLEQIGGIDYCAKEQQKGQTEDRKAAEQQKRRSYLL